jgi:hypothetical protein
VRSARLDVWFRLGVDEAPQRGLAGRQIAPIENAFDVGFPEKLRGDRRVASDSEKAPVPPRRHGGHELTLAGRKRARPAHHFLSEPKEVLSPVRIVGQQMAELGLAECLGRRVFEVGNEHERRE